MLDDKHANCEHADAGQVAGLCGHARASVTDPAHVAHSGTDLARSGRTNGLDDVDLAAVARPAVAAVARSALACAIHTRHDSDARNACDARNDSDACNGARGSQPDCGDTADHADAASDDESND